MSCYDAKIIKIMRTDVILMIFNTENHYLSFQSGILNESFFWIKKKNIGRIFGNMLIFTYFCVMNVHGMKQGA